MKNSPLKTLESEVQMPMMSLPTKSILVSIGDRVVLISPLPDIEKFEKEILTFGTPTDIVAPGGFHHLGIEAASKMFPSAKLWCVPALKNKRKDIAWTDTLSKDWPFQGELDVFLLEGLPKLDEALLYHRASKTLILCDLCFNLVHGKGMGNWLITHMFGTYKKLGVSRFFSIFVKDKALFRQSIQEVLNLDVEKIIIPHGEDVTEAPMSRLKKALSERHLA